MRAGWRRAEDDCLDAAAAAQKATARLSTLVDEGELALAQIRSKEDSQRAEQQSCATALSELGVR